MEKRGIYWVSALLVYYWPISNEVGETGFFPAFTLYQLKRDTDTQNQCWPQVLHYGLLKLHHLHLHQEQKLMQLFMGRPAGVLPEFSPFFSLFQGHDITFSASYDSCNTYLNWKLGTYV